MALTLSRYPGERIYLDVAGVRIEVQVLEVRAHKVRLGIVAPPAVRIYRQEVWDETQARNSP